MRAGLRRVLSVVAIFGVALHTVLWAAVALPFATPALDPFTVICHSEGPGPLNQTPKQGPLVPAHACDHCTLCGAIAPPIPGMVLAAHFKPAPVLQVLRPASIAGHDNLATDPKLARGPPAFA